MVVLPVMHVRSPLMTFGLGVSCSMRSVARTLATVFSRLVDRLIVFMRNSLKADWLIAILASLPGTKSDRQSRVITWHYCQLIR